MAVQTWAAVHVEDVAVSASFYVEKLGWRLERRDAERDLARVVDADDYAVLLVGPRAGDVSSELSAQYAEFRAGQMIRVPGEDLEARCAAFQARGLPDLRVVDTAWGDRVLDVPAPEGYTWRFVAPIPLASDEVIALYAGAPDALEAALAGLPAPHLDHHPAPDAWSIRQIAHHIVDGDDLWAMAIKAALTASGSVFSQDWYSTDNASARTLDYAHLSLEPALALFRAHRAYIVALIRHLPDAWERHILFTRAGRSEPARLTVAGMVDGQARHAREHVEEIRALRRRFEGP